MKNLLFLFLIFIGIFSSCKDDDDQPQNCGCEAPAITTIPEPANLVGKLFYKNNNIGN